jgi:DNA repair exonuclease SbcCD ATPase subunit
MLLLKKLTLKDFMCFSDAQFDFDNNIILISGQNGQGKSAVLEAISLALTSKKRSTSYQDYVKQGKESALIVLDCVINNEPVNFNIQINLVKGTTFQIDLTYKGKLYQNKETEEIIESFGLNYYSDLMFSMQAEDDITKLTPAQRAYYLQKLLNFDFDEQKIKLKKDIDQFDEIIKINKIEIPLKENSITREKDSMEGLKQVIETEEDISLIKENIITISAKLEEAEKNIDKLNLLNNQINEINNNLLNSKEKINEYNAKINSVKEQLEKNEKNKETIASLEKSKYSLLSTEKGYNEDLDKKNQLILEISNEIKDLSKTKLELLAVKYEIEKLEDLYDKDECPVCGQETKNVAEKYYVDYISKHKDLINNTPDSILECKEIILNKLSTFEKQNKELESELENCNKEVSLLKEAIFNIKVSVDNTQNRIANNLTQINENYSNNTINNLKLNLEKETQFLNIFTTNKNKLQEEIKSYSNIKIGDIRSELELLKNRLFNYNNTINTNIEISKRNEKRNENITTLQKEIDVLIARNFELNKQKETFEEAYKIFDKDLPNFMAIKACATLQDKLNNFIQNIFPTYEVRLEASKKGCEFFYTKDNTIKENLKKKNNYMLNAKMSSGFERVLLTLAFKISLAELYNCDCLFLDEADGSADEDNSQILYEYLIDSGSYNQIFFITHKISIKDFVTNNYQAKVYEIENGAII